MANQGWILIHRQIQDCSIWVDDEPFDRRSAWIDLLLLVNHRDKQIIFNGSPITVVRGQYLTSIRKLAERWNWSYNRTVRYLKLLEELQMISRDSDNHRSLITVENYGVYQDLKITDERTDECADECADERQTNNVKELKENTISMSTPKIDYEQVVNQFNKVCKSFPTVTKISDRRKKAIKARLNTYTIDELFRAFELAEQSDFLKGKSNSDWSADFDWIIKDTNLAKILDGKYNNKKGVLNGTSNTDEAEDRYKSKLEWFK